nr:hypothetical protein [Tanacetum cinerariifolium]
MSIQEMEDLKQQYLDEIKRLINSEYRDEIKIDELKENFNSISIEINKKEKLQQLEQVANLGTYPSKRCNSFCYDDDDDEDYTFKIISSEFNPIHNDDLDSTLKNDRFDIKYYLLESLFNRDTLMASSPKFDSFLEEFSGELAHTNLIPLGINEAFYDDHVKEISSGSTNTHSDSSLYYSFIFDLLINPFPLADRSDFYEFVDETKFLVIHPPPQETSIEILHDQENEINYVETFLRKFNRYSFFETPEVLLLAWDRVFEIKDALGNKQYKPKDTKELFRELFNNVQNIHEELVEYINTSGWNRPAFYNNGDDDDEDCTIIITSEFLITDSLSMGDEHLDTIPKKESDEFNKSSVEDLVLNLSEFKDECECDVPIVMIFKRQIFQHFSILSYDDSTSSDDESSHEEYYLLESLLNRDTLMASSPKFDSFLEEFSGELAHTNLIPLGINEAFYDDHVKEISSGSTTTHSDSSLYYSFIFDLLINPFPLADRSDFYEFADETKV